MVSYERSTVILLEAFTVKFRVGGQPDFTVDGVNSCPGSDHLPQFCRFPLLHLSLNISHISCGLFMSMWADTHLSVGRDPSVCGQTPVCLPVCFSASDTLMLTDGRLWSFFTSVRFCRFTPGQRLYFMGTRNKKQARRETGRVFNDITVVRCDADRMDHVTAARHQADWFRLLLLKFTS